MFSSETLWHPEIIVPTVALLFLCIAVPIVVTFLNVSKMRQGVQFTQVPAKAWAGRYARLKPQADWAFEKGFDAFIGMYVFKLGVAVFVSVWRHKKHPTYFLVILMSGKPILNFITGFSENLELSTASAKHFQLCPQAPGHYMQTFSKLSLDGLFDRHLASARFLTTKGGIKMRPVPWGFEEAFTRREMAQAAYLESLPLWFLRAPYWFYLRRRFYHNKTIEELHRAGKVLLPNDRGFTEFTFT